MFKKIAVLIATLTAGAVLSYGLTVSAGTVYQVIQGGTGAPTLTGWLSGNGTSPFTASTSPFFSTFTFGNATGTNATTTNFFATTASSTNLFSSNLTVGGSTLVTSGGNVGIGTTTPSAVLSTNATAAETVNGNTVYRLVDFQANSANQYKIYGSPTSSFGLQISTPNTPFRVDVGTQLGEALLFGSGNSGSGNNTFFDVSRTAATGGNVQLDAFNSGVGGTSLLLNTRFGGNVGIGTTNPGDVLHVLKAQNALTTIQVQNTTSGTAAQTAFLAKSNSSNLYIGVHSSGFSVRPSIAFIDAQTNNDLALMSNDTERVTIQAGGNVGIGITNPSQKLEVNGNLLVDGNSTTTNATTTNLFSTNATFTNLFSSNQTITNLLFTNATGTNATTTNLFSTTASSTNLFSSNIAVGGTTLVTSGGNVGIGTAAPYSTVTVRGANGVPPTYTNGAASNIGLFLNGTIDTANNFVTTGDIGAITGTTAAGNGGSQLRFLTQPQTNGAIPLVRMTITKEGNVGIGTTTPLAKLSVGGDTVIGAATAGGTLGDLYLPKLGTAAGSFIAVDAAGKVIATTTPSGGTGTVTSVTASTPNSTLTVGGTNPITTSGTISFDLNLAHGNVWTAASTTFSGGLTIGTSTTTSATTTTASFTTASTTNQYVSSLGTPAGTFVAADPSGKLIATTTPSSGTTIGATLIAVPKPEALAGATTNGNCSGNTTLKLGRVLVPNPITFNKISWADNGVTTNGSLKLALFSEDGQTQYMATTSLTTTANPHTATTTSPVALSPGVYYVAALPTSTTNVTCTVYNTNSSVLMSASLGASRVLEGTLTVTADTMPSTITPSAVTWGNGNTLFFRLDN